VSPSRVSSHFPNLRLEERAKPLQKITLDRIPEKLLTDLKERAFRLQQKPANYVRIVLEHAERLENRSNYACFATRRSRAPAHHTVRPRFSIEYPEPRLRRKCSDSRSLGKAKKVATYGLSLSAEGESARRYAGLTRSDASGRQPTPSDRSRIRTPSGSSPEAAVQVPHLASIHG
jgi:hypothetical protein